MATEIKLERIYDEIQQLAPAELKQLRVWLDHVSPDEDESRELTEADLLNALKSYEETYGISSKDFVRRYDARDPEVLRFDQGGFWRTICTLWEQERNDETAHQKRTCH